MGLSRVARGRRAASTPPASQRLFSLRSHPTASTIEYLFDHAMHYASIVDMDQGETVRPRRIVRR